MLKKKIRRNPSYISERWGDFLLDRQMLPFLPTSGEGSFDADGGKCSWLALAGWETTAIWDSSFAMSVLHQSLGLQETMNWERKATQQLQ